MRHRISVYQMAYGLDESGKIGLLFPNEIRDEDNQSIIFAIPFTDPFRHPLDLGEFFEMNEFYFPFEIDGKYKELKGTVHFPEVVFSIPDTNYKITFSIDMADFPHWPLYPFGTKTKYKYIGKSSHLIPKNNGFLFLLPVDLYEMDELFLKHKGIFVGMTTEYGDKENLRIG